MALKWGNKGDQITIVNGSMGFCKDVQRVGYELAKGERFFFYTTRSQFRRNVREERIQESELL